MKTSRIKIGAIAGGSLSLIGSIIILVLIAKELGAPVEKTEWLASIFEVLLVSILSSGFGAFLGWGWSKLYTEK